MALPIVGAEFWVATEPKLDFQPGSGDAICKLRVKAQDRTYNKESKQWENGKSLWANATIWRTMAENTMNSIVKGDNVVITGKIYTREFETNGQKRESIEIDVIEIGPSLRFRNTPHGAGAGTSAGSATPPPANHTREPVAASTGAQSAAPDVDTEPPF
jgi:single-strand DNA-binding protein